MLTHVQEAIKDMLYSSDGNDSIEHSISHLVSLLKYVEIFDKSRSISDEQDKEAYQTNLFNVLNCIMY